MRLIVLSLVLGLGACDMGHLGNPVTWPIGAIGSGIENAGYAGRRGRVAAHVTAQHSAILADIRAGGGLALTRGANLARVPTTRRPELIRILQSDIAKFSADTAQARENLVVWLMVHGP